MQYRGELIVELVVSGLWFVWKAATIGRGKRSVLLTIKSFVSCANLIHKIQTDLVVADKPSTPGILLLLNSMIDPGQKRLYQGRQWFQLDQKGVVSVGTLQFDKAHVTAGLN